MEPLKPIIAVDIDDVIAQLTPVLIVHHNKQYGSNLCMESFSSSLYHEVWGGTYEESKRKVDFFLESVEFTQKMEPVRGALLILQSLKQDFNLHLVTARQLKIEEITRKWIADFFPNIFSAIHFANHFSDDESPKRSKSSICKEIGAKLLIDDAPIYAVDCAKAGIPVILFGDYAWSRNKDLSRYGEFITRAFTWDEVPEALQKILGVAIISRYDEERIPVGLEENGDAGISTVLFAASVSASSGMSAGNRDHSSASSSQPTFPLSSSVDRADRSHHHRDVDKKDEERRGEIEGEKLLMAAVQMCCGNDKGANIKATEILVGRAAQKGAQLICLPECCAFMGSSSAELLTAAESLDSSPYLARMCMLAKQHSIWLSVGGFPERTEVSANRDAVEKEIKVFNLHLLINPEGIIVSPMYRKIHLFDCPLVGLLESRSTEAGAELAVVDTPYAAIGLSVCYDLRFPELYAALCDPSSAFNQKRAVTLQSVTSKMSTLANSECAEVVLVPAAFTARTGAAHWEVLLRARAIENQCYIIAAAQAGKHNHKRESYGQTMIIDPWGKIVSQCSVHVPGATTEATVPEKLGSGTVENDVLPGSGEICYAYFDREFLQSTRANMPVKSHRRRDVFGRDAI